MDAGATGPMGGVADLLKAIAGLVSALAWPAIALYVFIRYHKQLRDGLSALAGRMPQAEGLELGPLKIALNKSAELATTIPVSPDPQDQREAIQQQTKVGRDLRAEAAQDPSILPEIRKKMDELARQYELIRSTRDAQSRKATDAEVVLMNKVVSQMRALAISCVPYWKDYADSERPGDRLAAVVIVQMSPDPKYADWLGDRFKVDRPFVFYHAALALQNMADQCWTEGRDKIKAVVKKALAQVLSFQGEADRKTVDILQSIQERE